MAEPSRILVLDHEGLNFLDQLKPLIEGNWEVVLKADLGGVLTKFNVHFGSSLDPVLQCVKLERLAIVCRDFNGLRDAERIEISTKIFIPNPVTLMDVIKMTRKTVVAKTSIPAGTKLEWSMIEEEIGGEGIGINNVGLLLGRKAAYTLHQHEPIDFGKIE